MLQCTACWALQEPSRSLSCLQPARLFALPLVVSGLAVSIDPATPPPLPLALGIASDWLLAHLVCIRLARALLLLCFSLLLLGHDQAQQHRAVTQWQDKHDA